MTSLSLAVDNKTLSVSQLKRGMKVRIGDSVATVASMKWRNGTDGEKAHFISFKGRTAAALEISFHDREPILAHLDQDVIMAG